MSYLELGKKLLSAVGPALAAAPKFKEVWDSFVMLAKPADQAVLKQTYSDLMAENDEGFARLDAKLAEAEKK